MTYGLGIIRVSDDMLRDMRRVAAAISCPATGTGGQNLDAALIVADGGPSGCADPAFDAHLLPIGEWAASVWNERLPLESLHMSILEDSSTTYTPCYFDGLDGYKCPNDAVRVYKPHIHA